MEFLTLLTELNLADSDFENYVGVFEPGEAKYTVG